MSVINLEVLVDKLDPEGRSVLEQALALAVQMQHSTVTLAHFLSVLLSKDSPSVMSWFTQQELDVFAFRQQALLHLDTVSQHPETMPSISQDIIDAVCEAWLLASLEYNLPSVTTMTLLLVLVKDPIQRQKAMRIAPKLSELSIDHLKKSIASMPIASSVAKPVATGVTSDLTTLAQFSINMTERARQGQLDCVIGRDAEIEQMIDVLLRRRQNNPILLGEPGVGKSAVVEGLAIKVAQGEVPDALKAVDIYCLDLALLQAGAGVKGEFERRLTSLVKEVEQSLTPIILFIDEAHNLIGAGGQNGQGDAANILKPALARGQLRTIAATTWREYKKYIETDAALVRRFQPVKIAEPSETVAIDMLTALSAALSQHHDIAVDTSAIHAAVTLTHRYMSERQLPDKAISVLDTALAKLSRQQSEQPLVANQQVVAEVVSDWTGVPIENLLQSRDERLIDLQQQLQTRVIGQQQALQTLVSGVQVAASGLAGHEKPSGVFLLVGPSGVGKTESATALAEHVYGGADKMTVINMSEYKEPHKVATLTGSPPGYVGYGEGGVLTEAVRRKPYSLVLLDEMEKAHPSVQDVFYNVFDKGMLQDSEGRWIDFKNSMVVMTSNAADAFIAEYDFTNMTDLDEFNEQLSQQLQQYFKPAFLGRVTVVPYLPLDHEAMQRIVAMQLDKLVDRVQAIYQAQLRITEDDIALVLAQLRRPEIGAREVRQYIETYILPALAKKLLQKRRAKRVKLTDFLPV